METCLKKVLSFCLIITLLFESTLKTNAMKINVNFPDLYVDYDYDVPDEIVNECTISDLIMDIRGDIQEANDYTNCNQEYLVTKNHSPLLSEWLTGLKDNPVEFFKAYFAVESLHSSLSLNLEVCLRRIKSGKPVRFGFCSLEKRLEKFRREWHLINLYEQGGIVFNSINVPTWSGWRCSFFEGEESVLEITIPIEEISSQPDAEIIGFWD